MISPPGLWLTILYGPRPTGCCLKASTPAFSKYFLGTIHPRSRGNGTIEGHEIRPGSFEGEANAVGIEDIDALHLLMQVFGGATGVALEGKQHIISGRR